MEMRMESEAKMIQLKIVCNNKVERTMVVTRGRWDLTLSPAGASLGHKGRWYYSMHNNSWLLNRYKPIIYHTSVQKMERTLTQHDQNMHCTLSVLTIKIFFFFPCFNQFIKV